MSEEKLGNRSLRMSLFFSAIIIISNFLIGIIAPILDHLQDEINFFDRVWRVVVGQVISIDYHDPMGSGPFQLAALLWHWLGPHYYVMRLAIALICLSIAFCGCIVGQRSLARRADLALLFYVTLAFQLSTPTVYEARRAVLDVFGQGGAGAVALGMAEFYDQLIVSALAILFVQTFGDGPRRSMRENAIEIVLTAFLLNVLFLTKISGFVLGLMILLAGCLLQGRAVHRLLTICAAMLAFATITAIEFQAMGLKLPPIIQDYELASHVRLSYSFLYLAAGVASWPLVSSVTLLVLFAMSQHLRKLRLEFRCIGLIIGTYTACQFALNMTNDAYPSMWLAPAAIASLACCMGVKPVGWQSGRLESWWPFSRLAEISVRDAIPLLIFVLVLAPLVLGSMVGIAFGALVSFGIETPYVITAGKGVSFRVLWPNAYAKSLNDAVTAIAFLNLDHEAVLNLDHANPFPVLFLAPPPKGIYRWSDLGFKGPRGAVLEGQEAIGDACVVTIPERPIDQEVTVQLVAIVRSKLATDFQLVYQDEFWSIYRRMRDCATAPRL